MPRGGRPPGAQLGRSNRGRAVAAGQRMWDELQIAEIDGAAMAEEDQYMRRARQLATVGRNKRGGLGWCGPVYDNDDDADETGLVDGVEYDLYDDANNTVTYAVQLAMKDKEEWLVERALERIRRAQVSGKKNVRISKRELEALEHKRARQKPGLNGSPKGTSTRRTWQTAESPPKGANGKTRPRRSASGTSQDHTLAVADDYHRLYGFWGHTTGAAAPGPQQSSPPRPRTPTMQPSRPQHSNTSPRSPLNQSHTPERYLAAADIQHPPYLSQALLGPQISQSGAIPFPRRGSNQRHISNNPFQSLASPGVITMGSDSDTDSPNGKADSGDEVRIIDVVQRRVPVSSSPRRPRVGR